MSSNDAFFQRCRGLLSRLVSNAEYFFVAAAAEFPVAPPVGATAGPVTEKSELLLLDSISPSRLEHSKAHHKELGNDRQGL